ncbi:Ankyrin repeat and SOCS box protein 3 [Metarhizium anisopliae]|nr:Ankyrin repeat and SOCS box protein 3 [Metarhizium anisopliae]
MASSTAKLLPDKVGDDIANGNIQGVSEFYTSADPSKQSDLLKGIAERAAKAKQVDMLNWVFSQGFQLAPDSLNNDFYHQVCWARSLAVWQTLVRNGVEIGGHHSEFIGDALSFAAYHGDVEIARLLLENGVDPNQAWGYDDVEPGTWAVVGEHPSLEMLRLMLQHRWRPEESGAHIAAAERGNMEALQLLVDHGADLELVEGWWFNSVVIERDERGTALYRAAYKGRQEPVAYLMSKGANVWFKDIKDRSVLWAAKQGGNDKVVTLLKESGLEE